MQLKKQAIRKAPTFIEKEVPNGVRRHSTDFNQVNNKQQRNRNKCGDEFGKDKV